MRDGAIRAWLAILICPALWTAQAGDPAELERLAERHRAQPALIAAFTWQVLPGGVEAAPRPPRQGSLAYVAPASYNIVVREPDGGSVDRWCSDGRWRWEATQLGPEDEPDVRGPLPAGDGDADSRLVLACLRLDLERLRSDYSINYELDPEGGRRLHLVALAAEGHPVSIGIRLDAAGDPVQVDIDQMDGSRWRLTVMRLERPTTVDSAVFRIAR